MRALLRFHVRVGARLALLAAAPLAGTPAIVILLQQDPAAALRGAARWLVGAPADAGGGAALAAACLALASWATPRIGVGQAGWLRHLPLAERARRRAALLAAVTAQAPVIVGAALLMPVAALDGRGLSAGRLVALPLACAAAALAAWPGPGSWRWRAPAGLALLLLAPAEPGGIAVAIGLLWLSERLCGFASASRTPPRHSRRLPAALLVAARALTPSAFFALLPAVLPLAAMTALRLNNDLPPHVARGAARFGGAFAAVFLLAGLAERLAVRRPAWAWARSLPCSAAARVREDVILLAACCALPVAATALLDPLAALQVAGCVPLLACIAAGALRPRGAREHSVAGQVLASGAFVASGIALLPWAWIAALLATPLVARAAAERERGLKVSRWHERHHSSVGDPLSWSAR